MVIRRYSIFEGLGNKDTPKTCSTIGTILFTNYKKECRETAERLKEAGTPYKIYDRLEHKVECEYLMDV